MYWQKLEISCPYRSRKLNLKSFEAFIIYYRLITKSFWFTNCFSVSALLLFRFLRTLVPFSLKCNNQEGIARGIQVTKKLSSCPVANLSLLHWKIFPEASKSTRAPNNHLLSNGFKCCFKLSGILLNFKSKNQSVWLFKGNLNILEFISQGFFVHFPNLRSYHLSKNDSWPFFGTQNDN